MKKTIVLVFIIVLLLAYLEGSAEKTTPKSWQEIEKEAETNSSSGNKAKAFDKYAECFRKCNSNSDRKRISRKLLQTKVFTPTEISQVELTEVDRVITNVKTAFLRKRLVAFSVPAKVQILTQIKVINPSFVKWADNEIRTISHTFLEKLTEKEKEDLNKLIENKPPSKLDDYARSYIRDKNYRMAIKLYWAYITRYPKLKRIDKDKILVKIHDAMERLITEVSFKEQEKIDKLFESDELTKIELETSSRFIFIGMPKALASFKVEYRNKLDVLYVLLSDLFSNDPYGSKKSRMTLLLYDDSAARVLSPSGSYGLYVGKPCFPDDSPPLFESFYYGLSSYLNTYPSHNYQFRVGMIEIGIQYARYFIESPKASIKSLREMMKTYLKYYERREVISQNIHPYDVSAGFFCYFILKYGMDGVSTINWLVFRSFTDIFRTRKYACRPRNQYNFILAFALASSYGKRVYEDLNRMRFNVSVEHHNEISTFFGALKPKYDEATALMKNKKYAEAIDILWQCVNDFPSQIGIDAVFRLLILNYVSLRKNAVAEKIRNRMGIIKSWAVIGPFYDSGYTDARRSLANIGAPEKEINYGRVYKNSKQNAKWGTAKSSFEGKIRLSYSYPNSVVAYALSYAKCEQDTSAIMYFSSNEAYRVSVNGNLVKNRTIRTGSFFFDDDKFPIQLKKGTNKILVKFHNASGVIEAGGRIIMGNGLPISGIEFTTQPLEAEAIKDKLPEICDDIHVENQQNPNKWYSRWLITAGNFVARDGILYPQSRERAAKWFFLNKYQRNAYPAPSNIAWLRKKQVQPSNSIAIKGTITQAAATIPRVLFVLNGEAEDDPLSGISVGLTSLYSNEPTPYFTIFRYDKLLYLLPSKILPAKTKYEYDLRLKDGKIWFSVNGVKAFNGLGVLPLKGKSSFGIVTWGSGLGFSDIVISSLK